MFIQKTQRKQNLKQCRGHWKLLGPNTNHNVQKYASLSHLQQIESLLMHRSVALNHLNYESPDNPFKGPITVRIHHRNSNEHSEYEIHHWNGAEVGKCGAFRIQKCQSDTVKANYYLHIKAHLSDIRWHWYDNDSSKYQAYSMGMDVERQMECSFQGCLRSNFIQNDDYLNYAALTTLKKAYIQQFGDHNKSKTFLIRFGFDVDVESGVVDRWKMITAEQVTVTDNAFSRSIQRIDAAKGDINDLCTEDLQRRFGLRMKGVYDLTVWKSNSNAEHSKDLSAADPRRAMKRRRSPSIGECNDNIFKKRKQTQKEIVNSVPNSITLNS